MSQTANQKAKRIQWARSVTTRRLSKARRHFRLRKKVSAPPSVPSRGEPFVAAHHVSWWTTWPARPWPLRIDH
ncbi:hypothetical protein GS940_24445 [Rhodococcus hoagii]|nr:hypothetical protein [Prescottella equi]